MLVLAFLLLSLNQPPEQVTPRNTTLTATDARNMYSSISTTTDMMTKTIRTKTNSSLSRRKFISYHSSGWEKEWLEHADEWSSDFDLYKQVLLQDQFTQVHDFLNATCTERLAQPYEHWCRQNDFYRPFYYNTQNRSVPGVFEWYCEQSPMGRHFQRHSNSVNGMTALGPLTVSPDFRMDHIFSRFVFRDEVVGEDFVEYIEPLVAGLRHPLARLHYAGSRGPNNVLDFRGYVMPPPPPRMNVTRGRNVYMDAGASQWSTGLGGPSLSYFTGVWKRQGIDFDDIYAYEPTTTVEDFMNTVPEEYKGRTHFSQTYIASSPEAETPEQPFIPLEIMRHLKKVKGSNVGASEEDYVLWKLDIDSPEVEDGSIKYLLEHRDSIKVDEIAWEHHIKHHPVMGKIWAMAKDQTPADMTLRQSYDFFLRLRQKGIRAHSWV